MGTFGKVISVHLRHIDLDIIDSVARHINHLQRCNPSVKFSMATLHFWKPLYFLHRHLMAKTKGKIPDNCMTINDSL